jgi:hypothetical protein
LNVAIRFMVAMRLNGETQNKLYVQQREQHLG